MSSARVAPAQSRPGAWSGTGLRGGVCRPFWLLRRRNPNRVAQDSIFKSCGLSCGAERPQVLKAEVALLPTLLRRYAEHGFERSTQGVQRWLDAQSLARLLSLGAVSHHVL